MCKDKRDKVFIQILKSYNALQLLRMSAYRFDKHLELTPVHRL